MSAKTGPDAGQLTTDEQIVDSLDIAGVGQIFAGPFGLAASTRAIPDSRDGLIPVRRRILYGAAEMGLWSSSKERKAAQLVGAVMGQYHPHGDSSIYGAAVNMAAPFDARYPLIDGQGNMGSLDGDPPAAMRYTEMRLTPLGEQVVRDLFNAKAGVVDWGRNYSEDRDEPQLLPSRFPVLLANGTNGIGWGSASTILPHNLGELIDACCALLDTPDLPTEKLAKLLPGPDFPGGATIVGNDDWAQILETGRGRIVVRAKIHVEQDGRKTKLVVTEIPYQLQRGSKDAANPGVQGRIIELVHGADDNKKTAPPLAGIVSSSVGSVTNESSTEAGTRLVIELEPGVTPERAVSALYRETDLQKAFTANQVVSVPLASGIGSYELMGTRGLILAYLGHQMDVLTRRTQYFLRRDEHDLEVAEAKIFARLNAEEIIRFIGEHTTTTADVIEKLMTRFKLSRLAAETISEMPVRTFSKVNIADIKEKIAALKVAITEYKRLLGSEAAMKAQLKTELREIKTKFGDERRTDIDLGAGVALPSAEELLPDEPCWLSVATSGLVARLPASAFKAQKRGGSGVSGSKSEDDPPVQVIAANTRDKLWLITDAGNQFGLRVADLDEAARGGKGTNVRRFLGLTESEKVVRVVVVPADLDKAELVIATANGQVKRSSLDEYGRMTAAGLRTIVLKGDDQIVSAFVARRGQNLLSVTSDGYAVRYDIDDVPIQGRVSGGVVSQKVGPGAHIVSLTPVAPDDKGDLMVLLSNGRGKKSKLADYPVKGRATRGVTTVDLGSGRGGASAIALVGVIGADSDNVVVFTSIGKVVVMAGSEIKRQGRATAGVITVNLSASAKNPETVNGGSVSS